MHIFCYAKLRFLGTLAVFFLMPSWLVAQKEGEAPMLGPYYPTPLTVVQKALEFAEVMPGELVYDLGSGDGRVLIVASEQFGARAVGFEIDPKQVSYSRRAIAKRNLEALATVEDRDLLTADFSKPDVIFVYLLPSSNDRVRPLIEQQARPGTRIVSHDFQFKDWTPEKVLQVEDPSGLEVEHHRLYLYRR